MIFTDYRYHLFLYFNQVLLSKISYYFCTTLYKSTDLSYCRYASFPAYNNIIMLPLPFSKVATGIKLFCIFKNIYLDISSFLPNV